MFNNIAHRSTNTPMMTWKSDEKHNKKQAKQKKHFPQNIKLKK
jgi:hypothetical protein